MSDSGTDGHVDPAAVRAAVDGPEPRTAAELAAELDADRAAVRAALEDLVAAGDLDAKTVGEGGEAVRVWFPAATGESGRASADGAGDRTVDAETEWSADAIRGGAEGIDVDEPLDDAVEDALAALDLPGTSEMMRDWRRDAVRAAYLTLRAEGAADAETIVEATYPGHAAGYDDREAWWDCVAPRLAALPGVERDGDRWRHAG